VLVADDDQGIRLLCRLSLEAAGMLVVEAADGEEAVERALAHHPMSPSST
jgi:CheY-like chemotaxis protein